MLCQAGESCLALTFGGLEMMDVFYAVATCLFFVLCWGFVKLCDRV